MQFDNQDFRSSANRQVLGNNNLKPNFEKVDLHCDRTYLPTLKISAVISAQIEDGMLMLNGKVVCSISQLIYGLEVEQRKSCNINNSDICSFLQEAEKISDTSRTVKLDFFAFESFLFQKSHRLGIPVTQNEANSVIGQLFNRYQIYCNGKAHDEHFGFRDDIVTHFIKETGKSGFIQVNQLIKVDELASYINVVRKSVQLCSDFFEAINKAPAVMRSMFGAHYGTILEEMQVIFNQETQSRLEMSTKIVKSMIDDYPFSIGLTRSNTVENKALTSFFIDSLIPLRLSETLCEFRASSYFLDDMWLKIVNRPVALYLEKLDSILVQQPNETGEYQPFSKAIRQIRQVGNALGYMSLM